MPNETNRETPKVQNPKPAPKPDWTPSPTNPQAPADTE